MIKIVLLVLLALPVYADDSSEEALRKATLICGNRATIARQVQVIRYDLGHSYQEFKTNITSIYVNNEGLDEIKAMGEFVYNYIPIDMELTQVFNGVLNGCMLTKAEEYRLAQLPSF